MIWYDKHMSKQAIKEAHDEVFAEVMARTNAPSKAMIAAEPALADKPHYAAVKAQRMLKKTDIQLKIQDKLEKQAKKALKNVDDLLMSDDENIKSANTWKVIEQIRGKAVTRSISLHDKANIEDALFQ